LFISNPFKNKDITSTHPSLDRRIGVLERMWFRHYNPLKSKDL
jgi:hypothetical protein